ncbi:hypothetical protein [Aureimonas sp. AU40]|uniref:hypothetical protein n=1 Tax=Aureimonas sp. AU40 TaxID=1637747 RepID=UPI000781F99B|nr:hypothetical protein [Aureimonas sp. AU40]
MPIRPEDRDLYPVDWPQLSWAIRFKRAGGCCEGCGVAHGTEISKTYTVRLACAHVDHDPTNNDPANLRAFCQRCHMLHDAPEHIRRRWFNWFKRAAIGDLFDGPYEGSRAGRVILDLFQVVARRP